MPFCTLLPARGSVHRGFGAYLYPALPKETMFTPPGVPSWLFGLDAPAEISAPSTPTLPVIQPTVKNSCA